MKYKSPIAKAERERIFAMFATDRDLRFSEIEHRLGIRSNMVAYHLERLCADGLIGKRAHRYALTRKGERYLPMLAQATGAGLSPLPVVLVDARSGGMHLLIERAKRPYQGYWALPGGKIILDETFEDAARRVLLAETGLRARDVTVTRLLHERVLTDGEVKHAFLLHLCVVRGADGEPRDTGHGRVRWCARDDLKRLRVVPSDRWLLMSRKPSTTLPSATMTDEDGTLSGFQVPEAKKSIRRTRAHGR